MAIKLRVPCSLAKEAIREEITDLRKRNALEFSGRTEKTNSFSKFKFKDTSTIFIQLQKETLPLNETVEFSGWTKLSYETAEPQEGVSDLYSDGRDYLVRGKAILTDKDGYIAVSIENNTIEITDQTV